MVDIVNNKQQKSLNTNNDVVQEQVQLDQSFLPSFERPLVGGDIALRHGGMPNTGHIGKGSFSFQSRNSKVDLDAKELNQENSEGELSYQPFLGGGIFQSKPESVPLSSVEAISQSESPTRTGFSSFSSEPEVIDYQAEYEDLPTVTVLRVRDGSVTRGERRSAERDLNLAA